MLLGKIGDVCVRFYSGKSGIIFDLYLIKISVMC